MFLKRNLMLAVVALAVACGDDEPGKSKNNSTNNSSNNGSNNSSNNGSNNSSNNANNTSNNASNNGSNNTSNNANNTVPDMGLDDMGLDDMGLDDMGPGDMGLGDMGLGDAGMDTGDDMAGDMGTNDMGAGGPDPNAAAQIAAVRTNLTGTINGAAVTYVKATLGTDAGGFFVQATQTGPALFVETADVVAVGDIVAFDVTAAEVATAERITKATAISGLTVLATGYDVTQLTQNVDGVSDLVTAVGDYELELIDASVSVSADFAAAGTGHLAAVAQTPTIVGNNNLRVRLPDTMVNDWGLESGCSFSVNDTPLWRFNTTAQISAYSVGEISNLTCPPVRLDNAVASSGTEVKLIFSRDVDAASVTDPSVFAIDNGVTVTGVSVSGRTVTLTTTAQTAGTTYTVAVPGALSDILGNAIDTTAASTTFVGFEVPAKLRINEVLGAESNCDLIEFRVVSGGTLRGVEVWERNASIYTFPAMDVATNDIVILHFGKGRTTDCNPTSVDDETTSPNQFPAATHGKNFDTAYDVYSTDTGLTATDNVISVYDALGEFDDVLFAGCGNAPSAAANTETQAAAAAAEGAWQNVGGGTPVNGYVDQDYCDHAALGLPESKSGLTMQRIDDTDDNDKADWGAGAVGHSLGALNAGQNAF